MGSRRPPAAAAQSSGDVSPADRNRDTARGPGGPCSVAAQSARRAYRLKIHTCRVIFSTLEDRSCCLVNGALAKLDVGSARSQTTRGLATLGQFAEHRGCGSTPATMLVRAHYPGGLPGYRAPSTRGGATTEQPRAVIPAAQLVTQWHHANLQLRRADPLGQL
jgi:hypothetical protein